MRGLLKKIIEFTLKKLAFWTIKKYQPEIIGITGSVGKTSAKEAVYSVLSSKYRVWKNRKNYNNEIGVPLSILGLESGKHSLFSWLSVFFQAVRLLLFQKKDYPQYLILEMGADKPGDISYLLRFIKCHIGIVTAVDRVHTEQFGSLDRVVSEKQKMVSQLGVNDFAVLNIDDPNVAGMSNKTRAHLVTVGFKEEASVRAVEAEVSAGPSADPWVDMQIKGLSFKLLFKGSSVPIFLPSVLGEHQVYSALIAAAVGISLGMNLSEISENLKDFNSPPGRMRLIKGIKHTSIIDDTYNSSPIASLAALKLLKKIKVSGRKFAVFGDMLELGKYTEAGHREVGREAARVVNFLITVGERAKYIADEAGKSGLSYNNIFTFSKVKNAGLFLQGRVSQGDIILIKGSQGARMEKVVKEIMAEPEKASQLLVRQEHEWK